ncbi:50S ribosomal protein L6 [Legionella norrlandica]|uniref:Large ribosomal subunit protein uL6 n=1 Tax=Legionella norrlandica TaxID=1498499 RepID=A0A0A2STS8_9GAMM|nr:50S ribosomal protein L6 [Legionella norrlandica]KGP62819.1 50S ribosomal protein L6 [Legionella norrlandica]
MSRVAKAPVVHSPNVEVTFSGGVVTVKGPKGILTQKINRLVNIEHSKESNKIMFSPASNEPTAWAQAGTARALVQNMVHGVTEGFTLPLELIGVGYRAQSKGKSLSLSLGYSHSIEYDLPEGVIAETPSNTSILLKGADKQRLGQAASEIRAFRPPEPYKGKGVRKAGEQIARKEAKKK